MPEIQYDCFNPSLRNRKKGDQYRKPKRSFLEITEILKQKKEKVSKREMKRVRFKLD